MIDPEFWSDEEIGAWSYASRLFYIGLWNFADDEGRLKASSMLLKAQIFPYDSRIDVTKLQQEVSKKVQWYTVNSSQYGYLRNFYKHQRIDRPTPSRLPPPPEIGEDSTRTQEQLPPKLIEVKLSKEKLIEVYVNFEKLTVTAWNSFCDKYPVLKKIKSITGTRRASLKKRFSEPEFKDFSAIIEAVEEQPFLINGNPNSEKHKDWHIDFDWLIKNDTNYMKVLERKYVKAHHTGRDSNPPLKSKEAIYAEIEKKETK